MYYFFYKYIAIEDPEAFAAEHLALCNELGLLGRILVGIEGINGTVSGTVEQTMAYMNHMKADTRFNDIMWKIDEVEGHTFKKNACPSSSRNCASWLRKRH